MTNTENIRPASSKKLLSVGRYALAPLWLALAVSCGDATQIAPPGTGGPAGSGGSAGAGGTGGMAGAGGMAGTDGMAGAGGSAGTGGSAGAGGMSGAGGTGGDVGLCHHWPTKFLCDTDTPCPRGSICIPSGCEIDGNPVKHCVPPWAGSCVNDGECPNTGDYDCIGGRCIRVAAGCNPDTETYDCAPGFSCEGPVGQETCFDRRVPCGSSFHCPKSHVCFQSGVSNYCIRRHRTCHDALDCSWRGVSVGESCANVDGDANGTMECVGNLSMPTRACVNADPECGTGSVCEFGVNPIVASCGNYGLCLSDTDCGTEFTCAPLWQDGRKECVPTAGACDQVTDCPLPHQVCAAPRNGGPPSCQVGTGP